MGSKENSYKNKSQFMEETKNLETLHTNTDANLKLTAMNSLDSEELQE